MPYIKIEKGVVVEKILDSRKGYVEVDNTVICGMVTKDKGLTFDSPEPVVNPDQYKLNRAEQYPSVGDQLDAFWKEVNYRRLQGESFTQDADNMLGKILAVKSGNPKPKDK